MAVVSRFVQIILDYLKSNLPKLGDELRLTLMNVRIFADCYAPKHEFSRKITYMFVDMYTDERWVYIKSLIVNEERRFNEQRDQREGEIKKRKKYVKEKNMILEEEINEIEAELRRLAELPMINANQSYRAKLLETKIHYGL